MKVKTRRGVFINLDDSDITYEHNGKVYKFSSYKKRQMYLNQVRQSIEALNKLNGKLFRYTDVLKKDYTISDLLDGVYDKVYKNMLYK